MWTLAAAVIIGGGLLPSAPAGAIQFHVEAETVGDAYQLVRSNDELLNRRRLHQYLGFGAYDLTGSGDNALSLRTLFRFDADFGLTDEDVDAVRTLRREQLTIQAATLDGRGLAGGMLDFSLGRQMHADAIDFLFFDGLSATVKLPFHVGIELLGGMEADNDIGGITFSQLELDGTRFTEDPVSGDQSQDMDQTKWVIGAALTTADLVNTRARLSYRRIFSDSSIDDGGMKINQEKMGLSLGQRFGPAAWVHAASSYDLFNARFDLIRGGARVRPTSWLDVELLGSHVAPSFDGDSIFNVFSTNPYNDVTWRLRLWLSADQSVYASGSARWYEATDPREKWEDAELSSDLETHELGWGAAYGWALRTDDGGRVAVDLRWDGGYGGERGVADVSVRYPLLKDVFEMDGRVTAIRVKDGVQENLETWGTGYQLGGRYLVDERVSLSLLAEQNFNRIHQMTTRVFLVADLNLWL